MKNIMKQDSLEKFVLDHREDFDAFEPDDKLWDQIVKPAPKVVKFNFKTIAYRVAAVVVIFIASYFTHDLIQGDKENTPVALHENNFEGNEEFQELMEAEVFYSSQINFAREEIVSLSKNDPSLIDDINFDLVELDEAFKELKNDLKDNSDNEEVIEAMMQNYRLKLQILEEILGQLKKSGNDEKKQKQSHEI